MSLDSLQFKHAHMRFIESEPKECETLAWYAVGFALQLTQHAPKTHYHASDSPSGSSGTSFNAKNLCLTSLP